MTSGLKPKQKSHFEQKPKWKTYKCASHTAKLIERPRRFGAIGIQNEGHAVTVRLIDSVIVSRQNNIN